MCVCMCVSVCVHMCVLGGSPGRAPVCLLLYTVTHYPMATSKTSHTDRDGNEKHLALKKNKLSRAEKKETQNMVRIMSYLSTVTDSLSCTAEAAPYQGPLLHSGPQSSLLHLHRTRWPWDRERRV